jgi:hypothetical protein
VRSWVEQATHSRVFVSDVPFCTCQPDEADWIVERIVTKGQAKDGEILYNVKWHGFPSSANSWEPITNLQGCLDMVAQFNASTDALPEAHKEWQYLSAPVDRHGHYLASKAQVVKRTDLHGRVKRGRGGTGASRRTSHKRKSTSAAAAPPVGVDGAVPPRLAAAANAAVATASAAIALTVSAKAAMKRRQQRRSSSKSTESKRNGRKKQKVDSNSSAPILIADSSCEDDDDDDDDAGDARSPPLDDAPPDDDEALSPFASAAANALTGIPADKISAVAEAVRTLWKRQDAKQQQLKQQRRQTEKGKSKPHASKVVHSPAAASVSSVSSRDVSVGRPCKYCRQDLSRLKTSTREQHVSSCREEFAKRKQLTTGNTAGSTKKQRT